MIETPPESPPAATEDQAVEGLARRLSSDLFPTGDHAALRRMVPANPAGAALPLFRLLTELNAPVGRRVGRWALVTNALALARGRHDRGVKAGAGLHLAGVSEARVNMLLAADLDVLFDLLPRIARRLDSAGPEGRLDWRPLAALALHAADDTPGGDNGAGDEERVRKARVDIARQYSRAARAQ
jgi:CRISPR system Cascade subunit CasB